MDLEELALHADMLVKRHAVATGDNQTTDGIVGHARLHNERSALLASNRLPLVLAMLVESGNRHMRLGSLSRHHHSLARCSLGLGLLGSSTELQLLGSESDTLA